MNILHRFFPSLAKRKALARAQEHCLPSLFEFRHAKPSDQPVLYNAPKEDCWTIYAPWLDGKGGSMLRSSRIIMVSKKTGEILYDGSANDEV